MGLLSVYNAVQRFIKDNRHLLFLVGLCLLMTIGFLYFFYLPPAASIGPEQPIAFSHRIHAGVKEIQCRFCHPYVDRSVNPGVPAVEKCLYCHNYIIANHPEIRKEHEYYNKNIPTPWRKVFYLPEHVLFNHERHIKKEIDCTQCHGEVAATDRLRTERFQMGFCVACHRKESANVDCWLACHS